MATAIRSTVEEYMTPPGPKFTPFPASRITQKILSKHLDGKEKVEHMPTIREPSPTPSSRSDNDVNDDGTSSSTTLPPGSPPHASRPVSEGSAALKSPETITADTLNSHMYTAGNPPLDIFVRTSGVERLSDFMLWQAHQDTHIFFLKCLWPDFDLDQWIPVLLEWQWRQKKMDSDEQPLRSRGRKIVKAA